MFDFENGDINIMLSMINMKLRDEFSSLESFANYYSLSKEEIVKRLGEKGFHYSENENQFKRVQNMKNINKNRMGRNIVLIGMPASGKSTIGKLLAKKMNYEYYDADRYLERKENVKISTLFSEKGEEYFRNLETKYLKELSQKNGIIISTGGGAVKRKKNMQILGEKGIIVFLNRKIEDIVKENHEARPLLQNIDNIYKLYDERIELYNRYSDIIVENDGTLKEVTDRVVEEIEKIFEE